MSSDDAPRETLTPHERLVRRIEKVMQIGFICICVTVPLCAVLSQTTRRPYATYLFLGVMLLWTALTAVFVIVAVAPYVRFSLRSLMIAVLTLQPPLILLFQDNDESLQPLGIVGLILWFLIGGAFAARSVWIAYTLLRQSDAALPRSNPDEEHQH